MSFAGEDADRQSREELALSQNRAAWDKQVEHKDRLALMEKEIARLETQRGKLMDEELEDAHRLKTQLQLAIHEANRTYNAALAQAARERERLEQQAETQDSVNEIFNLMNSDLLNERSSGRDHRGLSDAERQRALQDLDCQIAERAVGG